MSTAKQMPIAQLEKFIDAVDHAKDMAYFAKCMDLYEELVSLKSNMVTALIQYSR